MKSQRLGLALEKLKLGDWERFERLCSAFLASEYNTLRSMATPSGDEGRDGELFSPEDDPTTVAQYSITGDWDAKIKKTAKRINETIPAARHLIYMSNHVIGAKADEVRKNIRQNYGIQLDVRDRDWFTERVNSTTACEKAAEELAQLIVDPFLAQAGVGPRIATDLTSPEAVAALTYLALQWQDDIRDKGLTKLVFEALVRAILSNTSSENRLTREEIFQKITALLPNHPREQIITQTKNALARLTKRSIRHWKKDDEFCLTNEESMKLAEFKTKAALRDIELDRTLEAISLRALMANGKNASKNASLLANATRSIIEAILLKRSQSFASAIQSGNLNAFTIDDFSEAIRSELAQRPLPKTKDFDWAAALEGMAKEILWGNDDIVTLYLKELADAFTLLAFLQETPDVQGAVEKMFSHGEIWLDATVVLPLLADTLLDEQQAGRFSRMISAARDAGLELYVTSGVIEEIERHMNKVLACARMTSGQWRGSTPYLLDRYVVSGRSINDVARWLENFRGDARPEEDIALFLAEEFGIKQRDLASELNETSDELRHALQQLWYEAHHQRRSKGPDTIDEMTLTRLVEHDVEAYCGVVQLRKKEKSSPFGYSSWWLTLDQKAFNLKEKLRNAMRTSPPDSPVLSADFLINYLSFGPLRRRVGKDKEAQLPLLMDLGMVRFLNPELLKEAEVFRDKIKELPERIIRRQVRDHLDRAKFRLGKVSRAGLSDLDEEASEI